MSADPKPSPLEGGATPFSDPQDQKGAGHVPPEEAECGFITLDQTSYSVGETAVLSWEIFDIRPHQKDFIGMFELDAADHVTNATHHISMDRLLDSRLRGDTSLSGGRLQWLLAEDIFPKRKPYPSSMKLDFDWCVV